MNGCPEPLEKIFQKVEEESERRAQEEIANQRTEATLTENAASSATTRVKNRRRGSISITRFGQLADESAKGPSTPKIVSAVASQSAFYQAQVSNESTASFASGASAHFDDDNAHLEEDNHVTQMHRIVGRQSISQTVGGLLPRRLSRSRSANVLAGEANVVIGVSVEEATVEAAEGAEMSGTSIHAPGALRNQPSRLTMAGSSPARNSWVAKAKGFTQKFRRKDK